MAQITSAMVKELREKTGAGMMDCKKALVEVGGEIETAVDWLRKKGLSAAAKKSGRIAAEGLVGVCNAGTTASVVEINAETDFVARNTDFQAMVKEVAETAVKSNMTTEDLLVAKMNNGKTVQKTITDLISVIGENMNLRRVSRLSVENGCVTSYVHSASAPNLGKIGVLVALESNADKAKLEDLGKKIAMHIAAAGPVALTSDEVDQELCDRERAIIVETAEQSGRPAEVIEKMVAGRMQKFFKEVVLLEQAFVMDGKTKVSDVIANEAKNLGEDIKITAFKRFGLGEGIDKKEGDFAAEVKAQAGV